MGRTSLARNTYKPKDITKTLGRRKEDYMTRSNASYMERITSAPPATFTSTQPSAGPSPFVNPDSDAGSISTPESKTGTNELTIALTAHARSVISSAIESYISTEL